MQDQQTTKATADEKIAHQAKTWRRAEKRAIGEQTATARQAEYHEKQKLRQVVDTLGGR